MIDMGTIDDRRVWYTGNQSIAALLRSGEIVAIPDGEGGVALKRTERCSALERMAAYTVEEAMRIVERAGK